MARLAQRMAARPGAGRQSAAKEEAEKERRRKNNRLCVAMVVIFGICWLPLNGINFIADINVVDIFCWRFYHFTFFLCHILAMSSNCYNPFLYAWLNDAFRCEKLYYSTVEAGQTGQLGSWLSFPGPVLRRLFSGYLAKISWLNSQKIFLAKQPNFFGCLAIKFWLSFETSLHKLFSVFNVRAKASEPLLMAFFFIPCAKYMLKFETRIRI